MTKDFILSAKAGNGLKRDLSGICGQCEIYGCGMPGGYAPYSNRYICRVIAALSERSIGKKTASYFMNIENRCL